MSNGNVFERDRLIRSASLTMPQTFFLTTLNQYVGNNSDAWPSQTTLASAMNAGKRSVQKWQQELEAMGVIQVDVGRGCQQTNRYRMDLSSLPIPTATNSAPRAPLPEANSAPHATLIAHHVRLNSAPRAHRKIKKDHRKEQEGVSAKKQTSKRNAYPKHFEDIWTAYPAARRRNKCDACKEYQAAIARVMESRSCSRAAAQSWMLQRVSKFAKSHSGQRFPPEPARWFKKDRFDDSEESWADFNSNNGTACPEFALTQQAARSLVPGDIASLNAVRAKLPEDVFEAARPMLYEITNPYQEKANRINFAKRLEELRK